MSNLWNISACVGIERYILSTLTPEKYPASESEENKDSCMWKFKQVKVNQSKTDRFMWKFKQVNQRKTEIDVCESLNKWATTNNISSSSQSKYQMIDRTGELWLATSALHESPNEEENKNKICHSHLTYRVLCTCWTEAQSTNQNEKSVQQLLWWLNTAILWSMAKCFSSWIISWNEAIISCEHIKAFSVPLP